MVEGVHDAVNRWDEFDKNSAQVATADDPLEKLLSDYHNIGEQILDMADNLPGDEPDAS